MGTLVLALTLGIFARAWLSPLIRLPYTCVVLIMGQSVRGVVGWSVGWLAGWEHTRPLGVLDRSDAPVGRTWLAMCCMHTCGDCSPKKK
jgi:hypothetical protein